MVPDSSVSIRCQVEPGSAAIRRASPAGMTSPPDGVAGSSLMPIRVWIGTVTLMMGRA